MPGDPYYRSKEWHRLRAQALKRDRHTCIVPGCGHKATTVDHIRARKDGGPDSLANLRCLCARHDNQAHREKASGGKRDARFTVPGCDADGMPLDPLHRWSGRGRG